MTETDMTDAKQYRAVEISDREYEYALNRMRRAYESGFLFLNVDLDRAIRRLLRERDDLAARLAAAQHQPAEGEEIMVNTPYDVFTLPLQPSGLGGKGPRFVVHVPGPEQQPAAVDGAIDKARFERAPCYLCGYNGPGYYQPDTHPCAAKYHAAQQQGGRGD